MGEIELLCGGFWNAQDLQIMELAIHPSSQHQGLGTLLMSTALQISTRRVKEKAGRGAAVLEVRVDNFAAQAVYEKLKFKRVGYRRNYYPDGTDAYLMRLPIL